MENKKFYWMVCELANETIESVNTIHPFIVMSQMRNTAPVRSLLNWKEISKDEHDLFNNVLYKNA
jgi:hypothetical protein